MARHQLQELSVHTYDAEVTLGAPRPLLEETALDGIDEFLSTCGAGPYAWPHAAAAVDYRTIGGDSWRLTLTANGTRVDRLPTESTAAGTAGPDPRSADASLRATASDLVLALHGRIPVNSLQSEGNSHLFDLLLQWDPDD